MAQWAKVPAAIPKNLSSIPDTDLKVEEEIWHHYTVLWPPHVRVPAHILRIVIIVANYIYIWDSWLPWNFPFAPASSRPPRHTRDSLGSACHPSFSLKVQSYFLFPKDKQLTTADMCTALPLFLQCLRHHSTQRSDFPAEYIYGFNALGISCLCCRWIWLECGCWVLRSLF